MLSFDDALGLVRKTFPQDYVTEGFEYDGDYVFRVLSRDYKKMHTNQSHLVAVNMNGGEVEMFDMNKAFTDLDGYSKAEEKSKRIDTRG